MTNVISLDSYRRQRDLETSEDTPSSLDDIRVSVLPETEFDDHVYFDAKTKEIIDL